MLDRLSASVSTALNKVSLLALVFQLALSNLAPRLMHEAQVLAALHRARWVLVSNVPSRQPVGVVRQILTLKAELRDLTTLASSAQSRPAPMAEASALLKSPPQVASDEAILPVRSAAEGTARRVRAA